MNPFSTPRKHKKTLRLCSCYQYFTTSFCYIFSVDTRRRFNIDTMSYNIARRRIAVETTSCVYVFRFCAGSNFACGVSEVCDCENVWQWYRPEIRLKRPSQVNHSAKRIHHSHHYYCRFFFSFSIQARQIPANAVRL